MFRVGDQHVRADYADEGFGGEIASLFALEVLRLSAECVVLVVFGADV